MGRRTDDNCESTCNEHSGIKTMVMVILVGVVSTVGMLSYNTFYAMNEIKSSIYDVRSEIKTVKSDTDFNFKAIDKRVSKLEDVVYKAK